jgi:endoglucanase
MLQHPRFAALSFLTLIATLTAGCAKEPPSTDPNANIPPVILPAAPAGSPVAVHGQLRVEGTVLKDQNGYPVQLKGVSSQWLNWVTQPWAESQPALAYMRDAWKLSLIRASMGTEANNGYLAGNETTMLRTMETIIQNAVRAGVYVLVDWHTEKAVEQQAEASGFFTLLAKKYGTYPNVIWETYNEPRGYAWEQIRPYHEAVVDAIRAVDPDNIVVLGTPNWSQDVDTASLDPVRPLAGAANLLYTLHFYSCTHQQRYRDKASLAIANGIGIFVTEFGATPANGGTASSPHVCRDDANLWFDWMAQNNVSGAAWKLDACAETSCILAGNAPLDGPWTDAYLSSDLNATVVQPGLTSGGGHGLLVVDWIRQ